VDPATREVHAYIVRGGLAYTNENMGSCSMQTSRFARELARMEVVDGDRFELRGIKVSVTVQKHMREKEPTHTVPHMTMHN
jgi:hypothetical protein